MDFYNDLKKEFIKVISENNIDVESEVITTVKLKPNEAIGNPDRDDYPILKGKEVLLNAEYKGFIGQAYTDSPSRFKGNLKDVLDLDLSIEENIPIFIAALNSVLRGLDLIDRTIHCKDNEPKECARHFALTLEEEFKDKNIGIVGLQPAILNELSEKFSVRVLDLDKDNIGKEKCSVTIEHGIDDYEKVIKWADVLLVTGSTCCNGSVINFINIEKPVYFYGTSIAGTAHLMNLNRLCFCAK